MMDLEELNEYLRHEEEDRIERERFEKELEEEEKRDCRRGEKQQYG